MLGKLVGVLGAIFLMVRLKLVDLPAAASWGQTMGVSFLCGIGFTMSLFIGLLAFSDPVGSLIAGLAGYVVLRSTRRESGSSVGGPAPEKSN